MKRARPPIAVLAAATLVWATPASAGPTLLFDGNDGTVMYAEDIDQLWHPASLTKIMTAYLTFEALKSGKLTFETKITTSENAHAQTPSKVGLPVGGQMTVDLAIKALIIKSANDVAVMLAEAISGTETDFIVKMNATAKRLGMSRTNYVNPHGLPEPEQITTARDLAKLSRAVLKDFPEYVPLWAMADMRIGRRRLGTHNGLLKTYEGADGIKTGFTCDSGYNVVASASRDGRRLMAVVLGESSGRDRTIRAQSLLEHGFQTREWRGFFQKTASIDTLPDTGGAASVTSVRQSVLNWDCGGAGRRRPVRTVAQREKAKVARIKAKGAKTAEGAAAAAASAAPAAGATPAAPKPKARAAIVIHPKAAVEPKPQ
ncbi:MAG: D-alanyl-D-alanine carboxypeptidase family protein [Hyphomicrobiaceae bacterium]